MKNPTSNPTSDTNGGGNLLKVLTAHYRTLVLARADNVVLEQYALLLRLLKSKPVHLLGERGGAKRARPERTRREPTISEEELSKASLDDLERIVTDAGRTRIDLEFIATQRFSVPHGSMRRFSSRESLVEKLRTLIANERTHRTIGAVARAHERRR